MEGESSSERIAAIEQVYKSHFPKSPFIYQFMDDYYRSFYEQDHRLSQLVTLGAFLAIFISCLGLLGLVAHSVEQRTKEISIRKVLGASVSHIIALISKDFLVLVVLAGFIAFPLAYYAMNEWLTGFAYRIELQWWVFALAGLAAIGIALLTISFQSVKAAFANPVESLRNE
ncbi:MAG: FtsX-like permease family protein [Bacteroidota bacterium]